MGELELLGILDFRQWMQDSASLWLEGGRLRRRRLTQGWGSTRSYQCDNVQNWVALKVRWTWHVGSDTIWIHMTWIVDVPEACSLPSRSPSTSGWILEGGTLTTNAYKATNYRAHQTQANIRGQKLNCDQQWTAARYAVVPALGNSTWTLGHPCQ
jgi:hypothetical protein